MRRFIATLGNAIKSVGTIPTIKRSQPNTPPVFETLESRELFSGGIQTGPIKWHPPIVLDAIQTKYQALGGANGFLGKAQTGELPTASGSGLYEVFQGGEIFWSAKTGAHDVYGSIRVEYQATANQTDYYGANVQKILGLPTSDEMNIPGVHGRMNTFQHGTIYWSPATGAHVVYGAISGLYYSTGGPAGFLGLPTSDEQSIPGGRVGYFQNGKIIWTEQGGARAVKSVSHMTFGTGIIAFNGGVPVGGSAGVTVYADGSYRFYGHFHNSGISPGPGYNDYLCFGLVSPSGVIYEFMHSGSMSDGLFNSRDDNWDVSGNSPALAAGWADLEGAKGLWDAGAGWNGAPLLDQLDAGTRLEQAAGNVTSVVSVVY